MYAGHEPVTNPSVLAEWVGNKADIHQQAKMIVQD